MDKQTVIAFVLIGALLILWMYLNAPEPQKQQLQKRVFIRAKKGGTLQNPVFQILYPMH